MRRDSRARFCVLAGAAFACWTSAGIAQQVYKWTDAAGTVHYEQYAGAKNAKLISTGSGSDATQKSSDLPVPSSSAAQAALTEVDKTQRTHMCEVARANLARIDNKTTVVDGADIHSARMLNNDDRLKARGDAQAQIGRYCDAK
jgi:Domain of unknown function (DUF4124)